jgi:hypothetical protein
MPRVVQDDGVQKRLEKMQGRNARRIFAGKEHIMNASSKIRWILLLIDAPKIITEAAQADVP